MILIEELQALIPELAEADLDVIAELERAAVAYVQTQTGRYFGPRQEHTEIVRGTGTCDLYLIGWAQDANLEDAYFDTELLVEERQYAGDAYTVLTDYDVRVLPGETKLVRHQNVYWTRGYEYQVTYLRGYAEGEEPADIRKIVLTLIRNAWNVIETGGMRSETIGGYSYTFGAADLHDLTQSDRETLDAWRRQIIA